MLLFTWHCNNAWKYIDRKYKNISLLLESLLGIQSTSEEWGCLRKQEWEHRRQNMNQSSSWPEQWHTAFCCIYRSVVLTMTLMNEELGKMKNLFQNFQLFKGSCLSKNPREADLALVTWKFATFPSSAACNIRCSFNGTTNMFCVNATQAHVCMFSLFLFYVYSLSVLWCLSMVKTVASLYLAFYLCFMIWLIFFFLYVILSYLHVIFWSQLSLK